MTLSSDLTICYNTLLLDWLIIKDIIKDIDEQLAEEVYEVRPRRVPRAGMSVLVECGVYDPPGT